MTTALAGCTSGTDGVPEVDEDALNELIQNNLQDFINNTTVVVNQDFHYHNNTTYVVDDGDYSTNVMNEYNNTTNIDGGEVNNYETDNSNTNYTLGGGGDSSSIMQMFTVEWDWEESADYYDYGNHTITLDGTLQQNSGDPTLLYATYYNGYSVEFKNIKCEEYVNYRDVSDHDWQDYLIDEYGYSSSELYDTGRDIENFWDDLYNLQDYRENGNSYYPVREQCQLNGGTSTTYVPVFEIEIEQGQAIELLTVPYHISDLQMECNDGFSGGSANGSVGQYIGGQSDCTLTGIARVYSYHWYYYVPYYNAGPGSNNSESSNISTSGWETSNIPEWWPEHYWRFFANGWYSDGLEPAQSSVPESFSVYFMTHFVEVYEPDTE